MVDESEGEVGSGGILGARFEDDRLPGLGPEPVGDGGTAPFPLLGPGLFVPPFFPPPLNLPLLQRN